MLSETETALSKLAKVSGSGAGQVYLAPATARVFETAQQAGQKAGDKFVTVERLLLALAMSLLLSRRPRDLAQLAVLAVTLWQALTHMRHVAILAMLFGFWMPIHLDSSLRRAASWFRKRESISEPSGAFRYVLIGFFCGILPGIGAVLAAFMGYNEAVRWAKDRSKFGRGALEGVVSSETANNAATGAAMIPLLALGLPGGALTAMMIGVFNVHDMEVGPLIMVEARELVWILFASMFWASLAILLLGVVEGMKQLVDIGLFEVELR